MKYGGFSSPRLHGNFSLTNQICSCFTQQVHGTVHNFMAGYETNPSSTFPLLLPTSMGNFSNPWNLALSILYLSIYFYAKIFVWRYHQSLLLLLFFFLLWVRLAAAKLREEEAAGLETELELRGDESAGNGPENEVGLKAAVPFVEDDSEDTLSALDEIDEKLSLQEEENEALLSEAELKKVPMQLAIAGRPNVGKSTLLNSLLREERVLTGPEPGLTRDSIRVEFEYEGQKIFLVSRHFPALSAICTIMQLTLKGP